MVPPYRQCHLHQVCADMHCRHQTIPRRWESVRDSADEIAPSVFHWNRGLDSEDSGRDLGGWLGHWKISYLPSRSRVAFFRAILVMETHHGNFPLGNMHRLQLLHFPVYSLKGGRSYRRDGSRLRGVHLAQLHLYHRMVSCGVQLGHVEESYS